MRWAQDVAPPTPSVPGRAIVTTADAAVRHCLGLGAPPGPVHLNLQLREPLAPLSQLWDASAFTRGLSAWQACSEPFTRPVSARALVDAAGGTLGGAGAGAPPSAASHELAETLSLLSRAERGLLVVGELLSAEDVAACVRLGQLLGWPVAADVLSGLRVGAVQQPPAAGPASPGSSASSGSPGSGGSSGSESNGGGGFHLVSHMDHLLLGGKDWWEALRPDVVLQVGPHLTSKRLNQFLVSRPAALLRVCGAWCSPLAVASRRRRPKPSSRSVHGMPPSPAPPPHRHPRRRSGARCRTRTPAARRRPGPTWAPAATATTRRTW